MSQTVKQSSKNKIKIITSYFFRIHELNKQIFKIEFSGSQPLLSCVTFLWL